MITVSEAARRVGKDKATLYLAIRSGKLRGEYRYGVLVVSEADMARYKPRGRGRPQTFRADIALRTDISQSELARELGVSRQYVNQILRKEAFLARMAVTNAVKKGILQRPDCCERCDSDARPPQAHHPDYNKRLEVQWLCPSCHSLIHPHHPNINGKLTANGHKPHAGRPARKDLRRITRCK